VREPVSSPRRRTHPHEVHRTAHHDARCRALVRGRRRPCRRAGAAAGTVRRHRGDRRPAGPHRPPRRAARPHDAHQRPHRRGRRRPRGDDRPPGPHRTWVRVATTTVDDEGRFTALWRTDTIGRVVLRAIVAREGSATAAGDPLTAQVTIFRPAIASWYGPGFFGRQTACGTRLTRKTVGVAHKTLPCGTPVELYYGGRTLTVPVIDRGPFIAGRDWDLTQAAARQLGVKATVRIGFLPPAGVPLRGTRAAKPRG
jgi:hypothetical protein